MKSLCIVGNSHLGALAKSVPYKVLSDLQINVDFWGVAGKDFPNIKTSKATLISPNPKYSLLVSNGKFENVNLEKFDVIWFHACHIEIFKFCKRMTDSLLSTTGLSQSFRESFVEEEIVFWWGNLVFFDLYNAVSSYISKKSVFLTVHPLYSENYLNQCGENELSVSYIEFFESILAKVTSFISRYCGENEVVFIEQPLPTVVGKIFTADVYSKNSVKLATDNKPHPETDYVHMNEKYGHLLWAEVLDNISPFLDGKQTKSKAFL
ncbi:hypothetical protein J2X32_002684 [Rheinheimera pacifica]|uniref:hypothetical protein n=1 Tax=Rheinheimera pacifica TaxID=173990 RepID=UPI00286201CA|nr:hypothetical protein [Rheinheimera pacifica]MDR6984042.1 hypothetical protein [Rheinheimera pacifica]